MRVSLTEEILQRSLKYLEEMPKAKRKAIGHYISKATITFLA